MFVTLILADLDSSTGRLRIARAGHNPAFLYQESRSQLVALQPEGIALGMDKGDLFATTLKVQEYVMKPGDVLVLYTDGIVEAMDPDGNEYTSERFAQVLTELHGASCREIVSAVVEDVEKHAAGADPSDDITLIVLKRED